VCRDGLEIFLIRNFVVLELEAMFKINPFPDYDECVILAERLGIKDTRRVVDFYRNKRNEIKKIAKKTGAPILKRTGVAKRRRSSATDGIPPPLVRSLYRLFLKKFLTLSTSTSKNPAIASKQSSLGRGLYKDNPHPDDACLKALAERLDIDVKKVIIFFRNKRYRNSTREDSTSSITATVLFVIKIHFIFIGAGNKTVVAIDDLDPSFSTSSRLCDIPVGWVIA
jgi:hypothetical protein